MLKKKIIIFCCFAFLAFSAIAQDSLHLQSPDGKIHFQLLVSLNGEVNYTVSYRQKEIVKPSLLGVDDWAKNLTLQRVVSFKKDTSWKPVYGERNLVRDNYQSKIFTFNKKSIERQLFQIEVRAYDEGIAFRYLFPENPEGGTNVSIQKELTE